MHRAPLLPLVRLAAPLLAVFAVTSAWAGIPGWVNSTAPDCITLVGSNGLVPAAGAGAFEVVVRDLANNTVAGIPVVIDLSPCADLELCADQMDPAVTVDCPAKTVRKLSNAAGVAQFTILGGSNGAGHASTLLNGGRIFVGGVLIKLPTVSALDLDGASGLGAGDLSAWLTDFGSGQPYGRSDYDCSGNLGAGDLSLWLSVFASGTITSSCGASCP